MHTFYYSMELCLHYHKLCQNHFNTVIIVDTLWFCKDDCRFRLLWPPSIWMNYIVSNDYIVTSIDSYSRRRAVMNLIVMNVYMVACPNSNSTSIVIYTFDETILQSFVKTYGIGRSSNLKTSYFYITHWIWRISTKIAPCQSNSRLGFVFVGVKIFAMVRIFISQTPFKSTILLFI